jgi:hypothetical protein
MLSRVACGSLVVRAKRGQEFLVATLLVGHTLLNRLRAISGEHHLHRFDNEEEDGCSNGH